MEAEKTMSLGEALRIVMDKIGNIRVPVREHEISTALDEIANDLYECILAIENNKKKETETEEAEVKDDVHCV